MSNTGASQPLPFGPLKRFGVFGGTFDHVHVGHLSIAQQIRDGLKLDEVVLVPAANPPHKQDGREMASAVDRLVMCRLAVRDMRGLSVSDYELRRGGVSYTVETARRLREAYGPEAQIYFLIGSDSLAELPNWYEIRELVTLADFAIAPFVRQFSIADPGWFSQQPWPCLRAWLCELLGSETFERVMRKYPRWNAGQPGATFP